ncbi:MAG: hypothetical protein HQL04_01920 [Nitrospirae bacterium]|nr:hypothetical protein [Nitrospirota bacterium]
MTKPKEVPCLFIFVSNAVVHITTTHYFNTEMLSQFRRMRIRQILHDRVISLVLEPAFILIIPTEPHMSHIEYMVIPTSLHAYTNDA